MKKLLWALALATAFVGTAHAADAPYMPMDKWFVHVGVAGVFYDPGFNGAPPVVPGVGAATGLKLDNNITAVIEAGRFIDENNHFALAISAGIPPTTNIAVTTAGPTIPIGSATVGTVMGLAQYHFNGNGDFDPYVGIGAAYAIVFGTTPAAPGGVLTISNAPALVLQAGMEVKVADHIGVFVDGKKLFVSSDVTTALGTSNDHFNPWIASAGIAFHF